MIRRLLIAAICLLLALPAHAQVAFSAGNTGSGSSSPVSSGNFTVDSASDRVIIVCTAVEDIAAGDAVTAVTWNGGAQSFTEFGTVTNVGAFYVQSWYLVNPTAATSAASAVIGGLFASASITAGYYSGAHQTTPLSDRTTNTGTGTAVTVTVPNASANDFIQDCMVGYGATETPGAGQTQIGTTQNPNGTFAGSRQDGTDGGVMSWTQGSSTDWMTIGVRVLPAGAPPATAPRLTLLGVGLTR